LYLRTRYSKHLVAFSSRKYPVRSRRKPSIAASIFAFASRS